MDARTQALFAQTCFMQMMACTAMMTVAQAPQPYVATEQSAAATRRALYASGMTNVPGKPAPKARKLTRDDLAKIEAAKWGFVR